nr:hypothetical protein [Pseudomonas sp.]
MPALPRLLHHRLSREDNIPIISRELVELRRAHQRTSRYLGVLTTLVAVLIVVLWWAVSTQQ